MTPDVIVSQGVNGSANATGWSDRAELVAVELLIVAGLDERKRAAFGTTQDMDADIGRLLLRARELVGRGNWLGWLQQRAIEIRMAQRLIKAATDPALQRRRQLPAATRWLVWERDDFRCHYCGTRQFLETDHKVAVEHGGSDDLDNIVTACKTCNTRKGLRSYEAFIAEIGGPAACRQ